MKNKDRNVGLVSKTINGGTTITVIYPAPPKYLCRIRTHLPVSPLVAPTTVRLSCFSPGAFLAFRRSKKNSNRLPSSCKATSLNANVGPWNNSNTNVFSSNFLSGAMSGCRNEAYDRSTKVRSSFLDISSGDMYRDKMATDKSTNEYDSHSVFQFVGRDGIWDGMYRPPFGARPVRTVCRSKDD